MTYQKRRDLTLADKTSTTAPHLAQDIATDIVIVGGGVAWLHAALKLLKNPQPTPRVLPSGRPWPGGVKKIVLIEQSICGGGMSGRSGGFLTPDSELGYRQYESTYGEALAKEIRSFGVQGQQSIVENIRTLWLDADLRQQDSLLLWWKTKGKQAVQSEHEQRISAGFDSELFATTKQLHNHNTGTQYSAGLRYGDCFGINPLQYCQALKSYLISQGVEIYEHTALHKIEKNTLLTPGGRIEFDQVIFAMGKVTPEIDPVRSQYTFGIQNFITVSEPLTDRQIKALFPDGKDYMCRDTQMVFTYYRLVSDNRLLVGWGNPVSSFLPFEILYDTAIERVVEEVRENFPVLREVKFGQYRSGRIQATKDLMPIIECDDHRSHHIWIQGAVGLPRAARSGEWAADLVGKHNWNVRKDLDKLFSSKRKFLIPRETNNSIFKSMIFWLCNARAMGMV